MSILKKSSILLVLLSCLGGSIAAQANAIHTYDFCWQDAKAVEFLEKTYPGHKFNSEGSDMTYMSNGVVDFVFHKGNSKCTFFVKVADETGKVYYVRTRHSLPDAGQPAMCTLREASEISASLAEPYFKNQQ